MSAVLIFVFLIGYLLIAIEHSIKVDKAAAALITGVLCWITLVFGVADMPDAVSLMTTSPHGDHQVNVLLAEHIGKIAEILFFLLAAMTIVEVVDAHDGFRIITERITTAHPVKLLWILSWVTFFLSAVLDNLTTAIVICALLRRIIPEQEKKWLYGGFAIIAANAGGAWSPIGDVTTIMLWIGGQVTTFNIIKSTFLASFASLLVPLLFLTFRMQKRKSLQETPEMQPPDDPHSASRAEQNIVFFLGVIALLWVPFFKTYTHMPPYMGILLSLGILWVATELIHRSKHPDVKSKFSVSKILQRIDTPSILFFLGILLAVTALESSGHLKVMADTINQVSDNIYLINSLIGVISSIVDNVPLVAACMGMYDFTVFPPDHDFWELLAYCAGTGGSILIIGSAAGVATMGLLKIDFVWYLKKISFYALAGYFAGIGIYYIQHHL